MFFLLWRYLLSPCLVECMLCVLVCMTIKRDNLNIGDGEFIFNIHFPAVLFSPDLGLIINRSL